MSSIPSMVLSFREAESRKIFVLERQAATKLMEVVEKIDCKLVLDKLTKADGNCMIIAMIQQCQRADISRHLPAHIQDLVQGTITPSKTSQFRAAVHQFVTDNKTDPNIQYISSFLTKSFEEYWSEMLQDAVWGDPYILELCRPISWHQHPRDPSLQFKGHALHSASWKRYQSCWRQL